MPKDTIELKRVETIQIPRRRKDQTWPNYFMERLSEEGVNVINTALPKFDASHSEFDVTITFSGRTRTLQDMLVEIGLEYAFEPANQLKEFKEASLKYQNCGYIALSESSSSRPVSKYTFGFEDKQKKLDIFTPGKEWPGLHLPEDTIGEKVLYVLAEFVRKRMYEQE